MAWVRIALRGLDTKCVTSNTIRLRKVQILWFCKTVLHESASSWNVRCSKSTNAKNICIYSVQLYIHITDVLFSLIMTQSLFSVHLLICFVCMGRSGPASRLSQAHYIDSTLQHTLHFNFNTDSGAVLLCKEMRAQLPLGPCLSHFKKVDSAARITCVWISSLPVAVQKLTLLPEQGQRSPMKCRKFNMLSF